MVLWEREACWFEVVLKVPALWWRGLHNDGTEVFPFVLIVLDETWQPEASLVVATLINGKVVPTLLRDSLTLR